MADTVLLHAVFLQELFPFPERLDFTLHVIVFAIDFFFPEQELLFQFQRSLFLFAQFGAFRMDFFPVGIELITEDILLFFRLGQREIRDFFCLLLGSERDFLNSLEMEKM